MRNLYYIEHHDIYDDPDLLEAFEGSRKEARARARLLRKASGVVRERFIRSLKDVNKSLEESN